MIKSSQNNMSCKHAMKLCAGDGVGCNLYDPTIANPKDKIVLYRLCDKNIRCPYKLLR